MISVEEEITIIAGAASNEKPVYESIRDGAFASIDFKKSKGLELTLSEVLKSILNTLQVQGVTDCTASIALLHRILRDADRKYNTNHASQVPWFSWHHGLFTYPADLMKLAADPTRYWACTPREQERCGIIGECAARAGALGQEIKYLETPYILIAGRILIPVPHDGKITTLTARGREKLERLLGSPA